MSRTTDPRATYPQCRNEHVRIKLVYGSNDLLPVNLSGMMRERPDQSDMCNLALQGLQQFSEGTTAYLYELGEKEETAPDVRTERGAV